MEESHSPWDEIEKLEMQCGDVSFSARWRAFVLACGNAVLPGLPLEARGWAEAAAKFDRAPWR
ncbi:hypothetical protein A6X21_17280 [Planctopirus hydrillae]|uniref:Uncharacterized protein n=1 Tax=Planctopirus hydrillae TaxID=1841610 RepID=A0A1C3EMG4_9PLAN|nr:hypothetical protein A6X21_17280 [Planctopirus hydrillae]